MKTVVKLQAMMLLVSVQIAASLATAQAQNDHLLCYQILRDTRNVNPTLPTLELTPKQIDDFAVRTGCRIRPDQHNLRARELCIPVAKSPSGPPSGPEIDADYACYRVRCEDAVTGNVTVDATDQFGSGAVRVRQRNGSRRLCAPIPKQAPASTCPCNFSPSFLATEGITSESFQGGTCVHPFPGELEARGTSVILNVSADATGCAVSVDNANLQVHVGLTAGQIQDCENDIRSAAQFYGLTCP